MRDYRRAGLITCIAFAANVAASTPMQSPAALASAKRVVELLEGGKFDDVVNQFNAQIGAALSSSQMRDAWLAFREQVGRFVSFLDNRITTPAPGVTAVVLGCRFEKAAARVIVGFDGEGKIALLRLVPQPAAAPAATPPGSARFSEESVTVGAGKWALPGTLTIPLDRSASPGVVLVHGSGPSDQDATLGPNKLFRDIAWGLGDRGIAVLRYEKRTRHYAKELSQDRDFTVHDAIIDDAIHAAELLRGRREIDSARIFVLGHSLGGTVAPWIAAEDRKLAGLIILAGASRPLFEVLKEQLAYLASISPGGLDVDQALEVSRRSAPESYWKEFDGYNPAQVAATLPIPMIILQGERDYQVTTADLQGWRDALGHRRDVTIKSYPTLNHLFMPGQGKATPAEYSRTGTVAGFVLDDIAKWISGAPAQAR